MTTAQAKADMKNQIAKAQRAFQSRAMLVNTNVSTAVTNACLLIEGTAKRKMHDTPIDMSKVYRANSNRPHSPSVEGEAPAPDAGTLMRSVTHDIRQVRFKVIGRVGSSITNPPYGAYLENGTSRMAARPWLLPSVDANRAEIKDMLASVVKPNAIAEVTGVTS